MILYHKIVCYLLIFILLILVDIKLINYKVTVNAADDHISSSTFSSLSLSSSHLLNNHQNYSFIHDWCQTNENQSKNFIVQNHVDLTSSSNATQGLKNDRKRYKRSFSHERHIEIMVVADDKMAKYHGDNLHQYILSLMATVALIYRDPSIGNAINIAIVKLTVMDEHESRNLISSSASKTLRHFCRWQQHHNSHDDDNDPFHHDIAILLTREDLCRIPNKCDILGLAQSGQICDQTASCAVIEDNGLTAGFTIAHELGHVLGIPHDDNEEKCRRFTPEGHRHGHIMARMLDYNIHAWTWSLCSRHYITEFLDSGNGDCLLDKPYHNLLNNGVSRSNYGYLNPPELRQPGEIFDMNFQCELVFGPSSRICPYMPVCKRLWCTIKESGGCKTQHMPWADGTPCARNKWCQRGECVQIKRVEVHPIDGQWGSWSDYNECSRTCGGGVQQSSRDCDNPKPSNGGKYCIGQRIRYRSCNTHDCPENTIDFRDEQCVAFDGKTFNISHLPSNVKWTSYYSGIRSDSCKLLCKVVGTGSYYLLKQKVIDGTPCAPDSYDICVNGKCVSAGCNHVLGSDVRPDNCGVCGGDNSTCKIISGHLGHVRYGYNLVTLVPSGATNLDIRQFGSSSNDDHYLALKSDDFNYLLNGEFVVSMFKKTIQYNGVEIEYTGSDTSIERINSSKPLTKPLYIEVLSVGNLSSPELSYQYVISLKTDKYKWHIDDVVPNHFCHSSYKLKHFRKCKKHLCSFVWKFSHWSECSTSCGQGIQFRRVTCHRIYKDPNNKKSFLDQNKKLSHHQHQHQHQHQHRHWNHNEKPISKRICNLGDCHSGAVWRPGPWEPCSSSCGFGKQRRRVPCYSLQGKKLPRSYCDPKLRPQRTRKCNTSNHSSNSNSRSCM